MTRHSDMQGLTHEPTTMPLSIPRETVSVLLGEGMGIEVTERRWAPLPLAAVRVRVVVPKHDVVRHSSAIILVSVSLSVFETCIATPAVLQTLFRYPSAFINH
jgi:hypothetical protein